MKTTLRGLLTILALGVFASLALAGPMEDANRLYNQGDYRGALQRIRQAEQENPNNPVVYHALGLTLRRLGDNDGARDAWAKVLELDPNLRSIKDDAKFLQNYRSVGGTVSRGGASAPGPAAAARGASGATDIISALTNGNVYVHPDFKGEIDPAALENAVAEARPTRVKIVAVPKLGPYRSREAMAADLRERLQLGDGVVIVGTPAGISGSSGRLGSDQIQRSFKQAGLDQAFARGGLGDALAVAAKSLSTTVVDDRTADTNTTGTLVFLGLAGVGGFVGYNALKKKRALDAARAPVLALQRQALDNLSYVDGYLDLLPAGEDADRAHELRAAAYEEYAQAKAIVEQAKTPADVRPAQPMLETALQQLEACRAAIDKATGGTGVAMAIPTLPSLATDAEKAAARLKPVEAVQSAQERDLLQREIEDIPERERGVSFFSGRPMPMRDLIPVTIVIQGQKRQVLATRDEAEAIQRGETPNIRAFEQDGQYVPWYENRGYDPYRDYYGGWGRGGGGFGSLVDLYLLTHLFGGGLFGNYGGGWGGGWGYGNPGGYGGWGGGNDAGWGGDIAPPEHAGGFDFFGQQDYNEQSSDGGFGFGNIDFGGGDSGGGFDFGGGGDGGGGFDFGGGDFGGGD